MKTSIIILSFNNFASTTGMCLQMLASDSDFLSWEVIVVDNASDAATQSGLSDAKQLYPHVQFVFNPSNLGFSAGNNVGIRLAKGDVLVLLNSDAFPPPGMIGRMVEHFNDDAPWGLLAPVTNSAGNEQAIFTASDSMEGKIIEGVKYAQQCHSRPINAYRLDFCCVAIPRLVADKVGLLDEDFGRGYYEDFDYSLRVKQAGYQLGVTEDAFVYHRGSTSFGKVSKARSSVFFLSMDEAWSCSIYALLICLSLNNITPEKYRVTSCLSAALRIVCTTRGLFFLRAGSNAGDICASYQKLNNACSSLKPISHKNAATAKN